MWLRDAGVHTDADVIVLLAPEGPQRRDLADDISAEVVGLLAAGIKQRPRS